jgi:hypothetical protein
VPEHVKKAAREMGQRAFKQRLREIKMSEYDAQLYEQFSNAVSRQVITTHAFSEEVSGILFIFNLSNFGCISSPLPAILAEQTFWHH